MFISKSIDLAGRKLTLETGKLAPQANLAVLARYGETVILATAVANEPKEERDFFPLRIDYEERLYAGGFIKSSRFVKREGRPSDNAIIAARLIDHAIRPLFPKDFMDEVQVIITVLSVDQENDPEILSLIATSAVLTASNIPWLGPIAAARIGMENDNLVLNPGNGIRENSPLDMVVTGLKERIVGIEAQANEISEEKIVEAVESAHQQMQPIINLINEFAQEVGKKKYEYESYALASDLLSDVTDAAEEKLKEMIAVPLDKVDWVDAYQDLKEEVFRTYEGKYTKTNMSQALQEIEKQVVQKLILEQGKRPDGRSLEEIRPLSIELDILPRTHGSALFSRGLTQSLGVVTLGSTSLEQLIQNMYGEESKRYLHHYNGPPFSLGETAPLRGPGRREIGHGNLAEKALLPVIPSKEEFPYTIRVVSEILSQNGSSSMAATCSSTLALMSAGVPIKNPVAGIAIGLMTDKNEKSFAILTDIAGIEDWNGFMDYKMAGTRNGITAIQMDIKLKNGLALDIFKQVVERSKQGRLAVLDAMEKVIAKPRTDLSRHAPRIITLKIDPKKIGEVIGPGGKVIKKIIEETETEIDIDEDGSVFIAGVDEQKAQQAKQTIENLTREAQLNDIYEGTVTRILDFGAFVEVFPGKEGLIHISELAHRHVNKVEDIVKVGDKVKVKVIEIDNQGRINLSKKALEKGPSNRDRSPALGRRPPTGPTPRGRYPTSNRRSPGTSNSGFRPPFFQRSGK